jgi:hypothetical protein
LLTPPRLLKYQNRIGLLAAEHPMGVAQEAVLNRPLPTVEVAHL